MFSWIEELFKTQILTDTSQLSAGRINLIVDVIRKGGGVLILAYFARNTSFGSLLLGPLRYSAPQTVNILQP